jgi:hypothetical protein
MQIKSTETTETAYDITPAEGYTRNDIVMALQQGQALVRGDRIVSDQTPESSVIATINSSEPKTAVRWS